MAGAMRKMAVYLGLVEDDRYERYEGYTDVAYDDYDPDNPDSVEERAERESRAREAQGGRGLADGSSASSGERDSDDDPGDGVSPSRPATAVLERRTADLARIMTLHPRTYNEARTIGEHFREGTPVIMNLTEMVDSDAKRLVDFAAGLIFGLHGSIDRVTNKVFLLSPANVEVTAEDKARIAERGFFNQS
jgi:cell division inhibitor SepF